MEIKNRSRYELTITWVVHMETSSHNRYGFQVGSNGSEYIKAGNLAIKHMKFQSRQGL
jgi:hypothetical protein